MDAVIAAYLALDGVSFLLAVTVAAFFWRSHRVDPERSFGILAGAFAILALSHLTTTIAGFEVYPSPVFAAARAAGVFVSSVLIFVAYASRASNRRLATLPTLAWGIAVLSALGVLLYAWPTASWLPSPLEIFPWLRLAETVLLLAAAALAGLGAHPARLADLQVPAAYVCLALSRYTVALLGFADRFQPHPLAYAWRLAGLLLLVLVVLGRWPREAS